MNTKKFLIPITALLTVLPSVLAQESMFGSLGNVFGDFVNLIFVKLPYDILGINVFMRLMLGLVLFTVFYTLLMNLGKTSPFQKKNIALPISAAMAIISVVFIPEAFLLTIGFSYGFTVSFLLMAIPVIAIIYMNVKVFPTSETAKTADGSTRTLTLSERRVNHGIQAVIYYFLATLIHNYTTVVTVNGVPLIDAAFEARWIDMGNLVSGAAMVLFAYHIIKAIFMSEGYKKGEHEGWFEGWSTGDKSPFGGNNTGGGIEGSKETEESGSPDLSPIVNRISELRQRVDSYESGAKELLRLANEVRTASDDELNDRMDEFLDTASKLRSAGSDIESNANGIADMTELFQKLKSEQIVQLADIVRRYRTANEIIIDAINAATS